MIGDPWGGRGHGVPHNLPQNVSGTYVCEGNMRTLLQARLSRPRAGRQRLSDGGKTRNDEMGIRRRKEEIYFGCKIMARSKGGIGVPGGKVGSGGTLDDSNGHTLDGMSPMAIHWIG